MLNLQQSMKSKRGVLRNKKVLQAIHNAHDKKKKESILHSLMNTSSHNERSQNSNRPEHSFGSDEPRLRAQSSEDCAVHRLDPTTPKDLHIMTREIDEDDVNKLMAKLKEKPKTEAPPIQLDAKTQLVLDRVTRKKNVVRYMSGEKNKKKGSSRQPTKHSMPSLATPASDSASAISAVRLIDHREDNVKTAMFPVDLHNSPSFSMIEDDNYDNVPKLEEVLKMPSENIFSLTGNPTWMDYLEPTEEDKEGVEEVCPVGSEHIEMFHEKKFKMKSPPDGKIQLDQWLPLAKLQTRDEVYFTSDIVFCNTLRSLINVSSAKNLKPGDRPPPVISSNEMKTQCDDEALSVSISDPTPQKYYSYSRDNPIVSARSRTFIDKTIKSNKELN
ncbi:unnamed protein product [Caenorhabditis bovis]|uniref:Uncharacterized protein n=1 Tax=Caenorhabditis bovis TaxID=2654633 RepID=A0A8S1ET79_9PELO|nr:unnamed protein product [Caenorhabditis bovis]